MQEFTVRPHPDDPRLTRTVAGIDQEGRAIETAVVMERPLTLFLNGREIVTMMTIGDHPDYLAVGYLLNQNMLRADDRITGIDYDEETRDRRRAHRSRDRFRGQTAQEDADLGLRPGHRVRRSDGEVRGGPARPATRCCAPPGSMRFPARSTPRRASISPPARSMAACCARRTGRSSIWRMSAATTRSTRSPATCTSTASRPRARSSTPPGG